MRVGSEARQYADSVVKGEGIHPVGLKQVFLRRKILKVLKDMKAANIFSTKRDDVVKVCAGRSVHEELRNGPSVCPRRGGNSDTLIP